jgi:hypothetical protein
MRHSYKILVRKPVGQNHLGDLSVNEGQLLKYSLKKWGVRILAGLIWLRVGSLAGCCEHGTEPLGSIKGAEFLG